MTYTKEQVLTYAQRLCPQAGITRCTSAGKRYGYAEFVTVRGAKLVAPICSFNDTHFSFRSLLRVPKCRKWSYLVNGQAGKNARLVQFWGESAPCLSETLSPLLPLSPSL